MGSPAKQSHIKFNYHDYTLLPEDKRYELIEGDLSMTPAPTTKHQSVTGTLFSQIHHFAQSNQIGKVFISPTDVVLSEEDVVQPDILFVSAERRGIIKPENIYGAPDLVIEVVSTTSTHRDLVVKKKLYAKYGIREYWIVDPEAKAIEVMTWSEEGFKTVQVYPSKSTLHSSLLPGFALSVEEIFTF